MERIIFEKIVGPDFVKTNYKVDSVEDLKRVLQNQNDELNHRLYNYDCNFTPVEEIPEYVGFSETIRTICYDYYLDINTDRSAVEYRHDVCQKLKFYPSNESKKDFFISEFKELEKEYLENPYHYLLTPDNYYNEISTKNFFEGYWQIFKWNYSSSILKWKKSFPNFPNKYTAMNDVLYEDDQSGFSFVSLITILQKFTVLKIEYSEFCRNFNEKKIPRPHKFYPLVFSNPKAQEFFTFCIKNYEKKDVTKTLLSKYFEFFDGDGFILDEVKQKNFFYFVQKELEVDMKRMEPYTSSEDSEKNEYKSMKNTFFSE